MKKIIYSISLIAFALFFFSSDVFADTFSVNGSNGTGTLQTYTVPSTGTYVIEAWGAQGGTATTNGAVGGKGAYIKASVSLTSGEVLKILVGQQGGSAVYDGMGGGGSFVVKQAGNVPVVIAGGGGGASGTSNGVDASTSTSGTAAASGSCSGGTGGNGAPTCSNASGGGGFSTDGGGGSGNFGGKAYVNGGAGGGSYYSVYGGYGGGGGSHGGGWGGGGGGGYSGGGGHTYPYGGGGGGSYTIPGATNITTTAGVRTGSGQVTITPSGGGGGTITMRSSTTGTVSGGSSIAISVPAGTTTNDVLVAGIFANGNWSGVLGITPPSGWTEVQKVNNTSSTMPPSVALYYHKVTGAEPGSYTWTFSNYSGGAYGAGWIASFVGVDMTTPIDVSGAQLINATNAYSTPSITTTTANDMLVWDYAGNSTNSFSVPSGASTITSGVTGGATTGSGFYKNQAAAGASGSFASTAGTQGSTYGGAAILALRPISPVTTVASNGWSYNSFNVGITTTTTHSTNFGARYGTTNTGNCSTLTYGSAPTTAGIGTWTSYFYPISANVNPSTSYYYCAYTYDQVTAVTTYGQIISTPVTTSARPAPVVNTYDATLIDNNSAVISAGVNAYGAASTGFFRWEQRATAPASCASMPNTTTSASTGSYDGNYYPATYKMNTLLPGTKYYYCFQSTNGAVGYGAVKFFTTETLGGTGCALFPGSTIAVSGNDATVKGYLGSTKFQGTLLYKGSTDGFTASAFHTKANAQGATITLIKNQINNQVFGGFNPYNWSSTAGAVQGATAFLFNLTSNYKLSVVNYASQQTYNNSNYGPTWGGGYELGMPNATLNAAGVHYTNPSSYYEIPSSKGAYTYLDGGGGSPSAYHFTPSEIEIYKLTACTISKPSVYRDAETSIGNTQATLNGRVNPNGDATNAFFKWGTSVSDTCASMPNTTALQAKGSGTTETTVSQILNPPLNFGTDYYYCVGATNTYGTSYADSSTAFSDAGTPKKFTTLTPDPTVVTDSTPSYISSVAQLSGLVNPNGVSNTTAWFRWGAGTTSNCSTLATLTSAQTMANVSSDNVVTAVISGLSTGQTYSYCLVADNPASNPAISGIVYQFTAPTGCIAPTSGDYTISSDCQLQYSSDGVDMGNGALSLTNTATLTIAAGKTLTIGPNKKVGYGAFTQNGSIVKFGGASIAKGPIWVPDSDNDGYADSSVTGQLFSTTLPAQYIRRFSSESRIDCDAANGNIYQTLGSMVKDTDHDGYVDTGSPAAGSQCVGGNKTFNGRVYWRDSAGNYTWMYDSIKLGINDCDNASGRPCLPTISSVGSPTLTSLTVTWSLAAGPPADSYSLYYCDRTAVPGCTPGNLVSSTASSPFLHNSSLFCSKSYAYLVRAVNSSGTNDSAAVAGSTSACATAPVIGSPTSSGVTATSAVLGANVTSDGGSPVTGRGICWSKTTTSPSLTDGSTCVSTTGTTGVYTMTVPSLPSSSRIYYRGYAQNIVNPSYTASGVYIDTPAPSNKPIQNSGNTIVGWTTGANNFGWEFTPVHDGQITELWGYFGGSGGATVYLYNRDTGAQLASASIPSNTAWTKATLGTPVSVQAGTVYILSFYSTASTLLYYPASFTTPGKYSGIKIFRANQYNNPGPSAVIVGSIWTPFAIDLTYVQGTDSCRTLYPDADNDGYGASSGASSICSGVDASDYVNNTYLNANTNDCYLTDYRAHPKQFDYFTTARPDASWDFNCDGGTQYSLGYPPFQVCNNAWASITYATAYTGSPGSCSTVGNMPVCTSPGAAGMQSCGGTAAYQPGWHISSACNSATFWYAMGQQGCH